MKNIAITKNAVKYIICLITLIATLFTLTGAYAVREIDPNDVHHIIICSVCGQRAYALLSLNGAKYCPTCEAAKEENVTITNGVMTFKTGITSITQSLTLALSTEERLTVKKIIIPDGAQHIAAGVFDQYSNAEELYIPSSVTSIEGHIFCRCDTIIRCEYGSYAERYARENGYPYLNGHNTDGRTITNLNEKIAWVIRNYVTSDMGEREKALVLHNWLINNTTYDYDRTMAACRARIDWAEITIVHRYGICGTYAAAYKKLLETVGIKSYYWEDTSLNHAWNLVRINGSWYQVDCTWDDPVAWGEQQYPIELCEQTHFMTAITDDQRAYINEQLTIESTSPAPTETPAPTNDITDTNPDTDEPTPAVNPDKKYAIKGVKNSKITLGNTLTLKPTIKTSEKVTFKYTSSNTNVAKVSKKGVVTAVGSGKATITIKSNLGSTKTIAITVKSVKITFDKTRNKAVKKVNASVYSLSLKKGQTYTLKPLQTGVSNATFTFKSTDSKIARVNKKSGAITAKKSGTASIIVTSKYGETVTINVTIV